MSNVSVSVVIPIYNSEDDLAQCIESVLNQSFSDFELILIDDGSSDASGRICDDYALKDRKIKVVHQPNAGRTEARYRGVTMAAGEWLTFVDSDDQLVSDALACLFAVATDDTDIVLGNGNALPLSPCPSSIAIDEFRHLTVRGEGTIGVPWGSMYRRTLLTRWVFDVPRHIVNGEDYLQWLRMVFLTAKPVNVIGKSVYCKGKEHTCDTFIWTADYCYELNELRKQSIPESQHEVFLADMLTDRIANMFSVAVCCKKKEWGNSRYYLDILSDIDRLGLTLPARQRLFFMLPSLHLRRLYSWLSRRIRG